MNLSAENHQYYYKVHQQLFPTKLNYYDFVVCAVGEKQSDGTYKSKDCS